MQFLQLYLAILAANITIWSALKARQKWNVWKLRCEMCGKRDGDELRLKASIDAAGFNQILLCKACFQEDEL